METLPYTVIRSQSQYKVYCERLLDLLKLKGKTRSELDTIDLLRLLIKRWEEEQCPLSDSDPVEFLRLQMRQNNMKASDLAAGAGISKSLMSDIMHYRRRLSREVIRKLAFRLNVSQEMLNKPYNLIPGEKRGKIRRPANQPKTQLFSTPNRKDEPIVRLLEERAGKATVARLLNEKEITIWNVESGRKFGDPFAYLITNLKPPVAGMESDFFFTSAIKELIDPESGETIFWAES
jgi:HTH-type transcriptional regulator/antitoxin HigA